MILKQNGAIVWRINPGRAVEAVRRFGVWLLTMIAIIACLAGVGILLAPAGAQAPLAQPLETDDAGQIRQVTGGQCR